MRRLVAAVSLLACAMVGAAAQETLPVPPAGGWFWEARPYSTWTPAELIQFFTDSPWSRSASLVEPGMQLTLGGPRYFVQWYSAQTMREALVRRRQLRGEIDSQASEEFLAAAHDSYQIYIYAAAVTADGSLRVLPPDLFEGMKEEDIVQGARLQFSAQEYAGRPDQVEFVRDPATQELRGMRLTFERARAAVPPERAPHGRVQFTCPTSRGSLSASFSLSEMHRDGQPDL
ncbi:MAG: hypothetical protein ACRD4U_05760 [Candidatus Acidiferrales bacterium]